MALEACPACKRRVSIEASNCPKCGKPLEIGWHDEAAMKRKRSGAITGAVIAVPLAAFLIFAQSHEPDPCGDRVEAFTYAEVFIKQRLRSPSTAVFEFSTARVVQRECGTWAIVSFVDAKNAFGAVVRTPFSVVVEKRHDGEWILRSIDMENS
ncbi:MAG: hypothetical protein HOK11_00075 [Rhodospirillaceae bacterium]|nr:hypothetical protein [Rhodospirillaceae bacterium]